MNTPVINVTNLTKLYKRGSEEVHALKDVTMSIEQGEFLSIVGPSGSGKSTLLHMLGLLDTPTSGGISLNGHSTIDVNQGRLAKIRRDNIGFVFQQFLLLPTLTVRENIELPLLFSKKNGKSERVTEIMGLLGLAHRAEHLPHQLSGGEMQRVSIGRALINEPKLILADEPTGNLDSATAEKIFELFRKLNSAGLSLVVVTHNVDLAKIAHRVIRLKDGTIAAN